MRKQKLDFTEPGEARWLEVRCQCIRLKEENNLDDTDLHMCERKLPKAMGEKKNTQEKSQTILGAYTEPGVVQVPTKVDRPGNIWDFGWSSKMGVTSLIKF